MSYFDKLPLDLLEHISKFGTSVYGLLCLTVKRFSKNKNIRKRILNHYTVINTDKYGKTTYKINGKLHREDGPAVIRINGTKKYCINGKLHRIGLPAVFTGYDVIGNIQLDDEYAIKNRLYGTIKYYVDGKLHRENGPAIVCKNGTRHYYLNGKPFNENGPSVITGDNLRYQDGSLIPDDIIVNNRMYKYIRYQNGDNMDNGENPTIIKKLTFKDFNHMVSYLMHVITALLFDWEMPALYFEWNNYIHGFSNDNIGIDVYQMEWYGKGLSEQTKFVLWDMNGNNIKTLMKNKFTNDAIRITLYSISHKIVLYYNGYEIYRNDGPSLIIDNMTNGTTSKYWVRKSKIVKHEIVNIDD